MDFEKKVVEIDIDDILPNRFQPRLRFSEDSINELAASIKEHGIIQPIVVRKIDDKFEIIAGERRYKASLIAGKKSIPSIVTDLNDKDSAEVALIENVQRKDLTPIEEAISYKKILDMGYMTQDDLATKLGKTQSTVANKLRLLNLADETQEALLDEKISERHARSLLKLQNTNMQLEMLGRVISERMTVRKTDEEIDKMMNENIETSTISTVETPINTSVSAFDILDEIVEEIPTTPIFNDENSTPISPTFPNVGMNAFDNVFNPSVLSENEEIIEEDIYVPNIVNIDAIEDNNLVDSFEKPEQKVNQFIIDPGFMDIEKIENEAADIYELRQEPDMNSLLKPTEYKDMFPNENFNPEAVENKKEEIVSGKFFNSISETDDEEEDESISLQNLESFNFNFEETNLETDQNEENFEPIKESPPLEESTIDSLKEDIIDNDSFDIFNLNPVIHEDKIEEIEETINFDPLEDVINAPLDYNFVEEQPVPELDINTMMSTEEPIKDEFVSSSSSEPESTGLTKSFKEALNAIRECNSKIEKMGFDIDTEEFDFEDIYQVIFKINK